MHALPKLPFPPQPQQHRPSTNDSPHHHIQLQRKPTTASQSRNLSPFTFNNLKLPFVIIKQKQHEQTKLINSKKKSSSKIIDSITLEQDKPVIKLETIAQKKTSTIQRKDLQSQKDNTRAKVNTRHLNRPNQLHEKVLRQYQKKLVTSDKKIRPQKPNFVPNDNQLNLLMYEQSLRKNKLNNTIAMNPLPETAGYRHRQKKIASTIERSFNYETLENKAYQTIASSPRNYVQETTQNANSKAQNSNRYSLNLHLKHQGSMNRYSNKRQKSIQQSDMHDSLIVKSSRNSNVLQKNRVIVYQEMQPYMRNYFINQNNPNQNVSAVDGTFNVKSIQSLEHNQPNFKIFVTSNPKYHPLHQNQYNSIVFQHNRKKPNFSSASNSVKSSLDEGQHAPVHKPQIFTLLWTKAQQQNIYKEKSNQQFYNHVEGSHLLTSKERLNDLLRNYNNSKDSNSDIDRFYPQTFVLERQFEEFVHEYDWTMVKMTLKLIVSRFNQLEAKLHDTNTNNNIPTPIDTKLINNLNTSFEQEPSISLQVIQPQPHYSTCLSSILQSLTKQTKNEPQLKLLKLCLLLQYKRKQLGLVRFFEKMPNYKEVSVSISDTVYMDVVRWCLKIRKLLLAYEYTNAIGKNINLNTINQVQAEVQEIELLGLTLEKIDYRLIQLLKAYNYLFTANLPPYMYQTLPLANNIWLIKPFASSKAAGISLINNVQQFYTSSNNYLYNHMKLKSKYHNKLFMKYISNPLLIKHSGMDFWVKKLIKKLKKQLELNKKKEEEAKLHNQDTSEKNIAKYDEDKLVAWVHDVNRNMERFLKLEEKYANRKFDIRLWVLLVCQQHQLAYNSKNQINNTARQHFHHGVHDPGNKKSLPRQKKFSLYKYHTAYCRFARKPYSLASSDLQIHLTNYQMYKKSNSPQKNRNDRSLNSSIMTKNQYQPSYTEQEKNKVNYDKINADERIRQRSSLVVGKDSKTEPESVLMIDQLFEYLQFLSQIKQQKLPYLDPNNENAIHKLQTSYKSLYQSQLNTILETILQSSLIHLTHHSNTFELFGVDLLLDEQFNLYLLQINLNPGCSAQRNQKLSEQANIMVKQMFETVMGQKSQQNLKEKLHENHSNSKTTHYKQKTYEESLNSRHLDYLQLKHGGLPNKSQNPKQQTPLHNQNSQNIQTNKSLVKSPPLPSNQQQNNKKWILVQSLAPCE